MNFWEKVKKDLQRGVKEGITAVKERATVVKEKMEKLSEEGKRQYRIFTLKSKVQKELADLGGVVYDLSSKIKNPLLDRKVKAIISRIKKLETKINRLEAKKKEIIEKRTSRIKKQNK